MNDRQGVWCVEEVKNKAELQELLGTLEADGFWPAVITKERGSWIVAARQTMTKCAVCQKPLPPGDSGRRYCSNKCKQKAYRTRLGTAAQQRNEKRREG